MTPISLVFYHNLSPILLQLGPVAIRWYSLMYILGFVLCYMTYRRFAKQGLLALTKDEISDLIVVAFLGLLLGARTVYMLFYNFSELLANPFSYFEVWNGGLSFHGALLGIIIAIAWYLRAKKKPILSIGDLLILPVPLTLFLGRIGNFINGELYGKPVDPDSYPLCVVFPMGGASCRIPSQLFEALGEGLILFVILWVLYFKTSLKKQPGAIFGVFLLGYGIVRFMVEYLREPDSQLGLLWGVMSMGQLLSLPMIIAGITILIWGARKMPKV